MQDQPNLGGAPLVLAGVAIERLGWDESLDKAIKLSAEQPTRVAWIYANCVNLLRRDAGYKKALQQFELRLNDGAGVEIAGRLLDKPVRANLCGTDWIPAMLDRLNDSADKPRVFLLGATPKHSEQAAQAFQRRWPNLTLAGAHAGYFNDAAPVVQAIRAAQPSVLIVGLGVPRQEVFLADHWPQLTVAGVRLALAGGAIIDHFAGAVRRAPTWLRQLRLEWLFRLVTEPRRLWRRYLIGNWQFFWGLRQELWKS